MSYQPKTYRAQGGDEFVVKSGGKLTVESGGELEVSGTDWAAILAAIPTSDQEDSSTIWNDGGVLKVSTAG